MREERTHLKEACKGSGWCRLPFRRQYTTPFFKCGRHAVLTLSFPVWPMGLAMRLDRRTGRSRANRAYGGVFKHLPLGILIRVPRVKARANIPNIANHFAVGVMGFSQSINGH